MKHFYKNLPRKKVFFLLALTAILSVPAFSQVGFNNPNPDPSALIDMKSNDKGLLIPRMTTTDRDLMVTPGKEVAHALLVFDTDQNMFFVYDTISEPDRWVALNPWISQGVTNPDITTATTGNVGIGTTTPTEKLEVNGNIKSSGDINATGNISASAAIFTGTLTSNSVSTGAVTATGNISSGGTITANKFTGEGAVPTGAIIMWSGNPAALPIGWALCNGQNISGFQTPDLRGRFIVGYHPADMDYNTIGNTGGEKRHTLIEAEMPSHNHSFPIAEFKSDESESGASGGGYQVGGGYTTIYTNSKGGNQSHENRPPYYTLAYIMKLP